MKDRLLNQPGGKPAREGCYRGGSGVARGWPAWAEVRSSARQTRPRFHFIEALEDRISPAAIVATWTGGDGDWNDPSKWDIGVVPNNGGGNTYRAVLNVPGDTQISMSGAFTLDSIVNYEALWLRSGSTLNLVDSGSLNEGLIQMQYSPDNTRLSLTGTFTNDGTIRTEQTYWYGHLIGELYLNADTLIDGSGTIEMRGSTPVINGISGAVLTLGAEQSLLGSGNINVPVVNHGALQAEGSGWLNLTVAVMSNDGVLGSLPGGNLSLECVAGIHSTHDIVAAGGVVRLLNTSLELNGKTLLAQGGEVRLDNSTIAHGNVQVSDNGSSAVTLYNAVTFTDAPWVDGGAGYFQVPGVSASLLGDRHIPTDVNLIVSNASSLDLSGATPFHNEGLIQLQYSPNDTRLTLGGTFTNDGTLRTEQTYWYGRAGEIYLNADTLIDGAGMIEIAAGSTPVFNGAADAELTLGAGQTLHGSGNINVPVINDGTISADVSGWWLSLTAGLTNRGALGSTNGGYLSLNGPAPVSTTHEIVAGPGLVRLLNTSLELNGETLLAQGGEVRLDGSTIAHGNVQVSDNGSSAVTLYNAVTFTDAPWVDGGAGFFQVPGTTASLLGDRHVPADVNLILSAYSAVDLSGSPAFHNEGLIQLQYSPGNTRLTLGGTFTNDGTIRTEQTHWYSGLVGEFYLGADTLIDGSGVIELPAGSTPVFNGAPGARLRLGPEQTLRGSGVINVPVINQGTLLADQPGWWLNVTAGVTNFGTLGSTAGGNLSLEGAAGTTTTQNIVAAGGLVRLLNTTLELTGHTLLADGAEVRLDNSTIVNGPVRVSDNSASVVTLYNALTFTAAPWGDDGAGYFYVPGTTVALLGDRHIPADVNLVIGSGSSVDLSGSPNFYNEGLIQLQYSPNSTRLTLGGTFTNDGTIRTEQTHWYGHLIGEFYLNADTLVDGTGFIEMPAGSTPVINGAPGTTLTLGPYQTLHGCGVINVPVINHGALLADQSAWWLNVTAGVTNDGSLASTAGGWLSLEGAAGVNSTEDIAAAGGVVRLLNTTLELNGKTLLAQAGEVRLDNSTVAHGTVRVSDNSASVVTLYNAVTFTAAPWADDGAGYFYTPGTATTLLGDRHIPAGVNLVLGSGSTLDISGATPFHNEGRIQLQFSPSSTRLTLGGTFTNDGTVITEQAHWYGHLIGEIYLNADTLVDGSGDIFLNGGSTPVINGMSGARLTNGVDHTVFGGGTINVPVINHGTLEANGRGWLYVTAGVTNDGTLDARYDGYLSLEGAAGTTTTRDIVASNSGIVRLLNTSLELNGKTLLADGGEVRLDNSTIGHGTVQVSDNSASVATLYNTLTFTDAPWADGGAGYFHAPGTTVALLGDRHIPAGVNLILGNGTNLDVSGATPFHNEGLIQLQYAPSSTRITLGGTFTNDGTIRTEQTHWYGHLVGEIYLDADTLIDGAGNIEMTAGNSVVINGAADTKLTVGADQTLHGQASINVPVINDGTISADVSGWWLSLTAGLTNRGALGSTNGGYLSLNGPAPVSTTHEIVAGPGLVRLLNTSLELNGETLLAQGGEVRLDNTTVAHGEVKVSDNSASAVTLYNAVTFTAAPWVDGGAGYFYVPGVSAALLGDRHIPASANLILGNGTTLDLSGVPVFHNEGLIQLQYAPSNTRITLGGTFTNDGTIRTEQTHWYGHLVGEIYLTADTLIDGAGNIEMAAGNSVVINGAADTELTLGPSQTLHGQGVINVPVINRGTLRADVNSSWWLTLNESLTNLGELGAWNGGVLHAKKGVTLGEAGHFNGDASGYVLLSGDLLSTGTTGGGPNTHAYVRIEGSTDPLAPRRIEVVGRELGYTPAGFTENNVFAPLTLTGGFYQLVNLSDDVAGEEAIYIDTLNVPAGATLDLNGQRIHVTHSVIEGTVIGDLGAPTSQASVAAPVWLGTDLPVTWVGVDDERGTGIACFDVYVSLDGGVATLWLDDTTDTSAIYPAQDGHTYGFYTVARDNLGYIEYAPGTADDATAEVRVLALTTPALDGATEDALYGFTVHNNGEGLAGVSFTWSLTNAPGELAINPATGALSGTFDNTGVGDHAVTVRVDDSQGHFATHDFTLSVANVAGTFTAQTPGAPLLGAGYTFDLNSTDEGAGAVTYQIVSGPAWLTIDPATGTLGGTPGTRDLGQPGVTVSVDDGHGGTDTTSFTLDVQGQHLVLDPALRQTKAVFTDANGDAVTATLTGKTGRVHLYRAIAPDGTGQYLNTTAGDLFAIELDGTDLKSGLTLTPKANARLHLGDGFSTLGSVTGTGSLAKLSAAKFDVVGNPAIHLPTGTIANILLHDVENGRDITLGGTQATGGVSFKANAITPGSEFSFANGVKSFRAAEWLGAGGLVAPWIGKFTIAGDCEASLFLTDALAKTTLGTVKIGGDLDGATWSIAGKIASITVKGTIRDTIVRSGGDIGKLSMGASDDSVFGAGVDLATLIANGHADTAPTGTIKTFKVNGWKIPKLDPIPRFMEDTQVSAKIGTMSLHNWDGLGGLWAPAGAIKKITHHDTALKDTEHNWVFPEPARQVSTQPELFVHVL